jgi:hypothetical protein
MARTKTDTDKLVEGLFGSFLDKDLQKAVTGALGPAVDIVKTATLVNNLKLSLRSKVGSALGVTGGFSAGGVGGSAGGGNTLATGSGFSSGLAGGSSGKIGGVAVGGLSFGASMGTRASRPNSTAGDVDFGTSLSASGSFGVGSKAGFGTNKYPIEPSMSFGVSSAVMASFESSLLGAGFSYSEVNSYKASIGPVITESTQSCFNSAFGPELGYPNARGVQLLSADVTMKTKGPWTAWVEIDEPPMDEVEQKEFEPPTGPFVFEIDGVEYRGTVEPDATGNYKGTVRLKVIGGAGGFNKLIPTRNYAGGLTKVKTILDDILRDCGESISNEIDNNLLNRRLPAWHRYEDTGTSCMDILCSKLKCEWRVLRDGTVWIGTDEYPEVEPAGTLLNTSHSEGYSKYSMEYATLVPGIIVSEKKVEQVSYKLTKSGLHAELFASSTQSLLSSISERVDKKNAYTKKYRCKVVRQNGDGTVDVEIDDEHMKGRGVAKCAVRTGFPGSFIKVAAGARCQISWDDGDPSLPYVDAWEANTGFIYTKMGNQERGAAFTGGIVEWLPPPMCPFQGTVNGAPASGFINYIDKGQGVIVTGAAHLRI